MFIGRERELEVLNKLYNLQSFTEENVLVKLRS